jgi:hypothetical protein
MRPRCGSVLFSHRPAAVSHAGGRNKCTWCTSGCGHYEAPTGEEACSLNALHCAQQLFGLN